jgi:hypothetical protein
MVTPMGDTETEREKLPDVFNNHHPHWHFADQRDQGLRHEPANPAVNRKD